MRREKKLNIALWAIEMPAAYIELLRFAPENPKMGPITYKLFPTPLTMLAHTLHLGYYFIS